MFNSDAAAGIRSFFVMTVIMMIMMTVIMIMTVVMIIAMTMMSCVDSAAPQNSPSMIFCSLGATPSSHIIPMYPIPAMTSSSWHDDDDIQDGDDCYFGKGSHPLPNQMFFHML